MLNPLQAIDGLQAHHGASNLHLSEKAHCHSRNEYLIEVALKRRSCLVWLLPTMCLDVKFRLFLYIIRSLWTDLEKA